jgi:hypothetical protein
LKTLQNKREREKTLHIICCHLFSFLKKNVFKSCVKLGLVPPILPPSSSSLVQSSNNDLIMTTSTNGHPINSFGISSPKSTTLQTTCNICKRLLYSFEEILVC